MFREDVRGSGPVSLAAPRTRKVSIVDKRADQLEERLLFGPISAYSKELPDLGYPSAGAGGEHFSVRVAGRLLTLQRPQLGGTGAAIPRFRRLGLNRKRPSWVVQREKLSPLQQPPSSLWKWL
jgi:hypothetical protein